MENHAHSREHKKRKARSPSRSASSSSSSSTRPSHTFEKGINTLLQDIRKSVQSPTFSGGANVKPETVLWFLGTVENLFEDELSQGEIESSFFFVERTSSPLVDPCEN